MVAPGSRVDPEKLVFSLSRLHDCGWVIRTRKCLPVRYSTEEGLKSVEKAKSF